MQKITLRLKSYFKIAPFFRIAMLLPALPILLFASCSKGSDEPDPKIPVPPVSGPTLVETLEGEYAPLPANPLNWSDSDLAFMDALAGKQIIGLGEGTHGTAEFFNAKFRIFRYLVEKHGFRVFAIEADFGESVLINDAIQRGATNEISDLMKTEMLFWTWKTEEVRALLEWMSDYNIGKADAEKLQYFGIDAQSNFQNPGLLQKYLQQTNAPFLSFANTVLQEAKNASDTNFDAYGNPEFDAYLAKLDDLRDSLQAHETDLVSASSEEDFALHLQLALVIKQASEVQFAVAKNDFSVNNRDKYMADNTVWIKGFFNDAPIVVWAHNIHVSKDPTYGGAGGAMGRQLQQKLGTDYTNLAFLFARGTFTAITAQGDQYVGLQKQSLETAPKPNSLNAILSSANANVFTVELARLNPYDGWKDAYSNSLQYFHFGAVYNNNPLDYYITFNPVYYDRLIFFDRGTASMLLE